MKLSSLLQQTVERDLEIIRVVDDSRVLERGDVLVWDERVKPDATERVFRDALERGAAAVVSNSDKLPDGDVFYWVEDAGAVLSRYAAERWPLQPSVVMGVTGTSGKTSVAWFVRQLARLCGLEAASIGTLGVMRADGDDAYTGYTSPTALKTHELLDGLAKDGVSHAVMEVSSHALALNRMDGVRFSAVGITNIAQDHLDFHGDLGAYAAAKLRLFTEVAPEGACAVLPIGRKECWSAAAIAKQRGLRVLTVGTANAELVVDVVHADGRGLDVLLKYDAVPVPVKLPLVGSFQAENLAVALGLLLGSGVAWKKLSAVVGQVTGVPGRMESVATPAGMPAVVVDYAHKPDALERVLVSVKPQLKDGGKLWVVFGCGGNRDALKRPLMGGIAARLADRIVITDDNPRHEDAAVIRAAILKGVTDAGGSADVMGDRKAAIAFALGKAGPQDVIVLAGKGHETGQIVGDKVLPFDDREMVREIIRGGDTGECCGGGCASCG